MGIGKANVDLAVQLSVQQPQDSGEQHKTADDQSAGDEDVAQQQLWDYPCLQHACDGHLAAFSNSSTLDTVVPEGLHMDGLHFSANGKLELKMIPAV